MFEKLDIHPKSTFTTKNGVVILEVDETEFDWEYFIPHTYDEIQELFPEFEHPNKNGQFVIQENEEGIY